MKYQVVIKTSQGERICGRFWYKHEAEIFVKAMREIADDETEILLEEIST